MEFAVTGDRIVGIELIERKTAGGIVIPDSAAGNDPSKLKCLRIQVTAIGPGSLNGDATGRVSVNQVLGQVLSVGAVVVTNRYTNVLKLNGQEVRVFGPSDIIGIERNA